MVLRETHPDQPQFLCCHSTTGRWTSWCGMCSFCQTYEIFPFIYPFLLLLSICEVSTPKLLQTYPPNPFGNLIFFIRCASSIWFFEALIQLVSLCRLTPKPESPMDWTNTSALPHCMQQKYRGRYELSFRFETASAHWFPYISRSAWIDFLWM